MSTYRQIFERFKNHIATKPVDSFFLSSTENLNKMRDTYQALGSVARFLEWLEIKALEEEAVTDGDFTTSAGAGIFVKIGGCK